MWSINQTTRTPANPEPDAHESPHMWSICLSLSSSLSKGSSASGCVARTSHWASTNLTHVFWSPAQCFIAGLAYLVMSMQNPSLFSTPWQALFIILLSYTVSSVRHHTKLHLTQKSVTDKSILICGKTRQLGQGTAVFLSRPTSKFWHVLPLTQLWTLWIYCFTSSFISTWKQAHSPGSGLICDQGRCVYHTTSPQALTVPH